MPPAKPKPIKTKDEELLEALALRGVDPGEAQRVVDRKMTLDQVQANLDAYLPAAFRDAVDQQAVKAADRRGELREEVRVMIASLPDTKVALKILMSRDFFGDYFGQHAFSPDGRPRLAFESHGLEVECVEGLKDEFFILTADLPQPEPEADEPEPEVLATPEVPDGA